MSRVIENPYENFIALSRYARWLENDNRRETWGETVDRYFDFMLKQLASKHNYVPDSKVVEELDCINNELTHYDLLMNELRNDLSNQKIKKINILFYIKYRQLLDPRGQSYSVKNCPLKAMIYSSY